MEGNGQLKEPKTYVDIQGYSRFADSDKLFHRWVMSKMLRRPLTADEIVHHVNGDKQDNSHENLILLSEEQHYKLHVVPAQEARKLAKIEKRLTATYEAKTIKVLLVSFALLGAIQLILGITLNLIFGKVGTLELWQIGLIFLAASLGGWLLMRRQKRNES